VQRLNPTALGKRSEDVRQVLAWFLRIHVIDGLSSDARTSFGGKSMNLFVWLPAMFLLGLGSMGLFLAFVTACDRI
jgi:hypothetical protein